MKYAVLDGGKRIRPVLCLAFADVLGVDLNQALNFALSIELIHSYSLVHDDLPALDNDDYRRGKLSTHKKFGEAYGILIGDALLNLAYETALNKESFSSNDKKALKLIADYAGYSGMIAGQYLDLKNEKKYNVSNSDLLDVYENKTAKLLTAPILVASILADEKYYAELKELGFSLGLAFQIKDDLMDFYGSLDLIGKTPGKDLTQDKLTSIKIYGVDGAKDKLTALHNKSIEIVSKLPNNQFILSLLDNLYLRNK
jgi:geranylgeranyl diphosphate synthase type II